MNFDLDGFLKQLQNGEVSTSSISDLRNEDLQKKTYGRRIPFLKKERNEKSRLLILKSIAIPFNPFTCAEDDKFNPGRKFRTEKAASTTLLALKKFYNENAAQKELFLQRAKVDSWDTSNLEEVTNEDREVFSKFYVTNIFTINKVHINNKAVTGKDNGADFKVDIKRDDIGNIVEQWEDAEGNKQTMPRFLTTAISLGGFFSSVYLQQYKDWELTEGANKTDDDKARQKMAIMSQSPITEDRPGNTLLAIKLPLTNSLELDMETISKWEEKDFSRAFVQIPYTQKIRSQVEDFTQTYKRRDLYSDFYELDMVVPDQEDKKLRGQETKYNYVECPLKECKGYDKILNGVITAINSLENIDKIMLASSYVEPLTSDVIEALCRNLKDVCDLQKLSLTEGTVNRFGEIISLVWGDKADSILMDADLGELPEETITQKERELAKAEIMKSLAEDEDDELNEVAIELGE